MARAKGDGSVYKRADGKWVAQVEAGYDYDTGQRRRLKRVRSSRRAALDALGQLQREAARELPPEVRDQTVGSWLEWWATTLDGKVRPKTARNHRDNVRLHLLPALGRRRLDQLGPQHVEAMMTDLAELGYKPKTIYEIRGTLRTALKLAVRWQLLDRNAAADARPPKLERFEITPLGIDGVRRLHEVLEADRLRALYVVCAGLGLRQSEALGLTWDDVDLDPDDGSPGRIRVWRQLKRHGGDYVLEPYAKTSRSRRTLTLPKVCADAFRRRRREQAAERLAADRWDDRYDDWGLVFTTYSNRSQGRPLARSWVTHQLYRHCEAAGLPRMRFHDLRHTAAAMLIELGVPIEVIADILGHSTIKLTRDTYGHISDRLKGDAAARIDDALGDVAEPRDG